jgi:hypothetical protein
VTGEIPDDACGADLAVVVTARINASAVPAKMLVRALCIDAYSTYQASRATSSTSPDKVPRRHTKRDIHS